MGSVAGADIFILKAFTRRSILSYRNLANFTELVKTEATVDALGDMYTSL